jgi:cyclopropane fatty-acyl-phospholipid synthase-like methyltransferase
LPIVAIAVLLVDMLASLAVNAASAQVRWPGWLDFIRVHSWLSAGIFVVALVGLTWLAVPPGKVKEYDVRKVAGLLAEAVKAQWESETGRRRVFDPYALPVRWEAADSDLSTPWPVIVEQASGSPGGSAKLAANWAASPDELAGSGKELADVFFRVPTRRLVVLGEPGAGKTILVVRLVLEFLSLERRKNGAPVPVLLPVASWNPEVEGLHSWIVHWLATDPAGLGRLTPDGPGMARALLKAGLILPILDGFDEIPDKIRGSAIDKINQATKLPAGLILTARTKAYRDAVHGEGGTGRVLAGAAGIKLRPLDAAMVAAYLKRNSDSTVMDERWDAVLDTFSADDPPPVAQALTTPLMVTLARAIYNPRDNEGAEAIHHHPAELLDPTLFKEKEHVETYLLDKFIWAAYRPPPDSSDPPRRDPWNYEQVKRWLVFLARNQQKHENGVPDIAWWNLQKAAPRYLVATVLAAILAVIAAAGYPFVGFGVGITTGILTGVGARRLRPSGERGIIRGLTGGLVGGMAAGLTALAVLPSGPHHYYLGSYLAGGIGIGIAVAPLGERIAGLAGGFAGGIAWIFYENAAVFGSLRAWVGAGSHVMNGIGIALAAILTVQLASRRKVPAYELRWSIMWMACGAASGIIFGIAAWVQLGKTAGLLIGIAGTLLGALTGGIAQAVESDPAKATAPIAVLRRDRGTFLGSWLVFGVALGLLTGVAGGLGPGPTGHPNGVQFGIKEGLSNVIIAGVGLAFIQALWGTFTITRCWLALKGQLPWRLMTFLRDAHVNRGVFRQVGAAYQFRHIDLQRRIASWPAPQASGLSRQITVPAASRAPIRAMLAKAVVRRAADRLAFSVAVPGGSGASTRRPASSGEPVMRLERPESFYRRLGSRGLIGFGEAFQAADWDSNDLPGLLTVFVAGVDAFLPPWLQWIRGHSAAPRRPQDEEQTIEGSRHNARHHYALPNELFLAFLDETMCYSSAIFPTGTDGRVIADESILADAQRRKIDRLLDLTRVGKGTRLLEIGTGWGELPVRAARRGALVHTVTNMAEHAALARDRAARADVTDLVRVDQRDYRELAADPGSYDAIISVEMIEAVGPSYWPVYFQTLERLLAPQGRIGLQAMTMRHDRMIKTSTTYTWIDKYIFPGGLIPSIPAIEQTLACHTGLQVLDRHAFGDHYRATLCLWRTRLNKNWPSIAKLGFDEAFHRTWDFYLAYCEAGFAAGYLDVYQFLIGR